MTEEEREELGLPLRQADPDTFKHEQPDLIARVEAAEGPSFSLFAEAFEAMHGGRSALGRKWSEFCALIEAEAWLDAAMTLVPVGFHASINIGRVNIVVLTGESDDPMSAPPDYEATAATPALALCAAALKAREVTHD